MKAGITLILLTWAFLFTMALVSPDRPAWLGGDTPPETGPVVPPQPARPQAGQLQDVPQPASDGRHRPAATTTQTPARDESQREASAHQPDAHLSIRPARQEGAACQRPPTREVTKATGPRIYQWRDDSGRLHLSDTPPPHIEAAVYDNPAPAAMDYFELDIDYQGLQRVPYLSDRLRPRLNRVYMALTDLVGQGNLRRVELNLRILPDRNRYIAYASRFHPDPARTGGFYSTAGNQAVTYIYEDPDRTLAVAVHEGLHVIAAGLFGAGTVPIWLNEGLADYFEEIETRAQYATVTINEGSLRRARSLMEQGYPSRLMDLMTLDYEGWHRHPEAHYALSWALVFYLMDSEQGRNALSELLVTKAEHYCADVDMQRWLAAAYPGGEAGLDRDFRAWLQQASTGLRHRY